MTPSEPAHVIPAHRLPSGFAQRLEEAVSEPAIPRPAATVVLLREGEGEEGMEVLLLRRARSAGFVPGAYVFPGGRVDPADGSPEARHQLEGVDPEKLATRMGMTESEEEQPPAFAFLVAAFRETFEETGILPGLPAAELSSTRARTLRRKLVEDQVPFHQVLEALDARVDGARAAYIAHWVTPEAEPRRYDTRFFALQVAPGLPVSVQESEISHALWITPARALERHRQGDLPMIFPTIRTLEELADFSSPPELLRSYRSRAIPRLLPRLVPTPEGVGIVLPDPEPSSPSQDPKP